MSGGSADDSGGPGAELLLPARLGRVGNKGDSGRDLTAVI